MSTTLPRLKDLGRSLALVMEFIDEYEHHPPRPGAADFTYGNPQEMALPGFVDALRNQLEPRDPSWYAYKLSEPKARVTVASSLSQYLGIEFAARDIFMTNGGFAAIAASLRAVVDPGDEVIFLSPPWFFYELLIGAAGGTAIRVRLEPPDFDLDVDAIAGAITPRTRVVLVNTPHNPSGRIYSPERLHALASVLTQASQGSGRTIYLLSDEPYNRIVFDGRRFHSPAEFYPETLLLYSYGKTLLTPGQRLGYVALAPGMTDVEEVRSDLRLAQIMTGWAFPNALLQHAIAELDVLHIDVARLEARRDRIVAALREMGYELGTPEGTFYLLARSPIDDDMAFMRALRRHETHVLPGTVVELPGWFRISLTANDDMVAKGLVGFAAVLREL